MMMEMMTINLIPKDVLNLSNGSKEMGRKKWSYLDDSKRATAQASLSKQQPATPIPGSLSLWLCLQRNSVANGETFMTTSILIILSHAHM